MLNNSSCCSLFPQQKCTSPLTNTSSSGSSLIAPRLSSSGSPGTEFNTPGEDLMRAEAENPVPHPAGLASFDAAQDKVGFLGCKYTLLAYIQFLIHQYLLPSASLQTTLNQSFMQSTLKMAALGTDQTHVGSHTWPCWSSWEKNKIRID